MKGFRNVNAFVDGKFIKTNIGIDGAQIAFVGDGEITEPIACNGIVCPGFIDQHMHGAGGYDVMDATFEVYEKISSVLAREGVTSYLGGSVTQTPEKIISAHKAMAEYMKVQSNGAEMIGIHLEGPFLSAKKAGAHVPELLAPLDTKVLQEYIDASDGNVRLITVAPELDNAEEFIKYCVEKGITVDAGHTNATYEQFRKSIAWGVSCTTHTYNAMSSIHHRDVGVAGGAILEDVYNEVIADGVHVSFPAIKILANQKADKLILITDAMGAKGVGLDGEFEICGQRVYLAHGEVRLPDGTLAGSVLTLDRAVRNMVKEVGITIEQAINAVTVNPAKCLGVFDRVGSIEVGKRANFTILDDGLNVLMTIVGGKIVYNRE